MANPVKFLAGKLTGLLLTVFRIDLLTKDQTETYLNTFQIENNSEVRIVLPDVTNLANPERLVFSRTDAVTYPGYVWQYEGDSQKMSQLPYGAIRADNKVLCTDFSSYHLVKNFLTLQKRVVATYPVVIAPWSHFIDGVIFGGYYDFVILVAAKLCRIKEALLPAVFDKTIVSYPLFNTGYEQEFLSLIGFTPERVIDSRKQNIRFDRCILGNSGHWFYPHPADIIALKKYVEPRLNPQRTEKKRLYISRAGRRRVVNEASLITLLKKYDFTIVEDKPRSVAEQVELYKNASFIMGPHGASFTNIIWCEPGTHLVELFPTAMIVDHFRYLSAVMKMRYFAYHHVIKMGFERTPLEEDIFVSIVDLENSLNVLLGQTPVDKTN